MTLSEIFNSEFSKIVGGAIVSGIIARYFVKKKKLSLSYTLFESDLFPTDKGQGKFYSLKIFNDGGEAIHDIVGDIGISDAKIKIVNEVNKLSTSLELVKQTDSIVSFKIGRLNPKAEINCVITTQEAQSKSEPKVNINGEGVIAKDKTKKGESNLNNIKFGWGYSGLLIGMAIVFGLNYLDNKPVVETQDKPERIEDIFSILNQEKLSYVFPQILKTNTDDISYVGTAFYLTHSYLKDTVNKQKYIQALKAISMSTGVAPSTKGIIYYLLYKINTKEKNIREADNYINKCKTETPDMYQQLITQDQFYNLDSLQNWLTKSNH